MPRTSSAQYKKAINQKINRKTRAKFKEKPQARYQNGLNLPSNNGPPASMLFFNDDQENIAPISASDNVEASFKLDSNDIFSIGSLSDLELNVFFSSLYSKETEADFSRRLSSSSLESRTKLQNIWKSRKKFCTHFFVCNVCGNYENQVGMCCSNPREQVVLLNVEQQIKSILQSKWAEFLEVREKLKNGELSTHPLSSRYFGSLRCLEKGEFNVQLLLSVDGVQLNGHLSEKVWPVMAAIVDLKANTSQSSQNIVCLAILQSVKDPKTILWNTVLKLIFNQVDGCQIEVNGKKCNIFISNLVADQPAKRSVFGVCGHSSKYSCFYCIDFETLYKHVGLPLREKGSDEGIHTRSFIQKMINMTDLPIDLLHNFGTGMIPLILKELDGGASFSDMFKTHPGVFGSEATFFSDNEILRNAESLRTSTDKITYFRTIVLGKALLAETLNPIGRLAIVGLGMIIVYLHTNCRHGNEFLDHVTSSVKQLFLTQSVKYINIKNHEILCHLPKNCKDLGNIATLSTSQFESAYKVLLGDTKTSSTTDYCSNAALRFLALMATIREVENRRHSSNSAELHEIIRLTPHIWPKPEHAKRNLKWSKNCQTNFGVVTLNDAVFFSENNVDKIGVFSGKTMKNGTEIAIVRLLKAETSASSFSNLESVLSSIDQTALVPAYLILNHLKMFDGILEVKLETSIVHINPRKITKSGILVRLNIDTFFCIVVNGVSVHH